ncbi:MAG TPA: sensor histidine kinase [Bryobacteraceae bacterium]|nr:sensor histidine kinase [Bryobacteraceae bacterium]
MAATNSITQARLQRFLLLGLGISAALLLLALLVAARAVHQIDRDTETFAARQALTKAAIDDIEQEQSQLNTSWLRLAGKRDVLKREEVLTQLAESRSRMGAALQLAYEQTEFLRESIFQRGHGLLRWTLWLFCICVVLSILCASWTVRASTVLFQRLGLQTAKLTQLQYQFLETQEDVARRFSHELHDELGQALTAVKANLSALRKQGANDEGRIDDCMRLVDGAIEGVREMSQLLRPTILDDFGLDAALRSLGERFSERTQIVVNYSSNLGSQRLADQTETHLFRIAQEALTNVARHSKATEVTMKLTRTAAGIRLDIGDNGQGFDLTAARTSSGLGLAGMRTRAEGCRGMLTVHAAPGKGVEIEVSCPASR